MKKRALQNKISSLLLIITSFAAGFGLWYIHNPFIIYWLQVPLVVDGLQPDQLIKAPPVMHVALKGSRHKFKKLNRQHLALHINAAQLQEGVQLLHIKNENLFVPKSIKLVDYIPATINLTTTYA